MTQQTLDGIPIIIGYPFELTVNYPVVVPPAFPAASTWESKIRETTQGDALGDCTITRIDDENLKIAIDESVTAALSAITFIDVSGIETGYVFVDIIRTDLAVNQAANLMIKFEVRKSPSAGI